MDAFESVKPILELYAKKKFNKVVVIPNEKEKDNLVNTLD